MTITRSVSWIRALLVALIMLFVPAASFGHVGVSITIAPPALLVYSQPVCPGEGYIWTPGYWAWGDDGYFWVPGTWVLAPAPGLLWTPGYWGWVNGAYVWNAGYWGPHVGFYGGINYGFGYVGVGYAGGYWNGGRFFYNREVNNVNVTVIHNTYSRTVINNTTVSRVSFNGGHGGTTARPTAAEVTAAHERRVGLTSEQTRQQREASSNRAQFASVNHGRPDIVATPKPGEFRGDGVVTARGSASNHVTSSHAAEPSRTTRTSNTTTEHRSPARSENKPLSSSAHENNVKPKNTAPRAEPKHENTQPPVETRRASRTEAKPAEHQAKPPAQHESQRPAMTQHPPRTEARPVQQEAKPPAQHESAPREEKKPPKG
jgi:hypothetical protein